MESILLIQCLLGAINVLTLCLICEYILATVEPSGEDQNPIGNVSQTLFPDSPVYEPEEDLVTNTVQNDEVSFLCAQ